MANPQHVALARQGSVAIARWQEAQRRRQPLNLSGAFLSRVRLPGVDFSYDNLQGIDLTAADLRHTNLAGVNLQSAHLSRSNLSYADLQGANLSGVSLVRANLRGCRLSSANLQGADLSSADLTGADLEQANLSGARLTETNLPWASLSRANLRHAHLTSTCLEASDCAGADLRGAQLVRVALFGTVLSHITLEMTLFADCDLSQALGLDSAHHAGPSIIGLDSLARSRGLVPPEFLRQAGVSEFLIAALSQPAYASNHYSHVLLVGSHRDATLLERLRNELSRQGIPCWKLLMDDEEALNAGEPALQRCAFYDRLVLVCSGPALENPLGWRSFKYLLTTYKSARTPRLVVVALDEPPYTHQDEVGEELRQRTVLDFRGCQQEETYTRAIGELVNVLTDSSPDF